MIPSIRSLSRFLQHSRVWLLVSVALAAAQAALLIPVGLLLRSAFDDAIPSEDIGQLAMIGATLLGLLLASAGLGLWTRWIVLRSTKDAVARLRIALLERLQVLPASWFDRRSSGKLHSIVVQDSERVDIMANALAGEALPAAIICAALSVALAVIDPLLFVILAISLPAMAIVSRRLRPRVRRLTRHWQEAFDRFSARMHVSVRGRTLITTHSAEGAELEDGSREIRELSSAGAAMAWMQALYGQLNGILAAISSVIVLVVGGAAIANGSTSLGSLISFYALLGILRTQATQLLAVVPQVISGGESLARLEGILEAEEPPAYRGNRRIDFRGAIEIRDVRFGYGEHAVLESVEIVAEPGEWIALIGPNGTGKSTVAALALGLYRPWSGAVLADGITYDELDLTLLRRRMAVVAQDPVLLPGTVAENIALGQQQADGAAVREAAHLGGCGKAIESLPSGFETQIGDEGDLVSGGQRQCVAIARALLRRAALLILDEPTASLDRDILPTVLAALRALPWGPTVLLISHDPTVVSLADRVYVLDAGVTAPAKPRELQLSPLDAQLSS